MYNKGIIEDTKIKNSTVVHYLADKKHNIQHRNVYDTNKHVKLNYSSEYEGILLYISIDEIEDNNRIKYLATN